MAAVVAGMLLLPGRLLTPGSARLPAIALPATKAPAPVRAQPILAERRRAKAQPAVLTAVHKPVAASIHAATPALVVHHTRANTRPALITRLVRSKATRTALKRSGRPTKHETPPDPVVPKATPTPAATPPPLPAPAVAPAPTLALSQVQSTVTTTTTSATPAVTTGQGQDDHGHDHGEHHGNRWK